MGLSEVLRGTAAAASGLVLIASLQGCSMINLPGMGETTETSGSETSASESKSNSDVPFVDKDLILVDYYGELKDRPFRLNSDGTVEGPKETLLYMSKATHWRFENGTLNLCTSQACEYWSAWTISDGEEDPLVKGEPYKLTLKGAENNQGQPVTRKIVASSDGAVESEAIDDHLLPRPGVYAAASHSS